MADWTTTRLNVKYHGKTLLMVLVGLLVLGLFAYQAFAQEPYPWDTSVCEEGECPTRFVMVGFDVWISPTVYEAPDFTHAALGRELDTLKAQLLWMTSHNAVPKTAIQQLIASEVSIYLDVAPDWSDWWPCEQGGRGAACYNAALNRIGIAVLGAHWPYANKHGMSLWQRPGRPKPTALGPIGCRKIMCTAGRSAWPAPSRRVRPRFVSA